MISKNIFVVNCELNRFEDYFLRKRNSDIINPLEIHKRLTNSDAMKFPPSKDIVDFYIIKRINSFLKSRKKEFLYFYLESIDENFIKNLKSFFSNCKFPVNFYLLQEKGTKIPKFHSEFNSIQFLEND